MPAAQLPTLAMTSGRKANGATAEVPVDAVDGSTKPNENGAAGGSSYSHVTTSYRVRTAALWLTRRPLSQRGKFTGNSSSTDEGRFGSNTVLGGRHQTAVHDVRVDVG